MSGSLPRWMGAFAWAALAAGAALANPPLQLPIAASPDASADKPAEGGKPALKDLTPPELEGRVEVFAEGAEAKEAEHGFYGAAEYLLLRPRHRGLEFALVDPADDLVPQGRNRSARYDLRSGLKASLGYRFKESGWDVAFGYTYFHSEGDESATAPPGGLIYPQPTRPGLTDTALAANSHVRLNYNVYDIEAGKLIHTDEWTNIRFFGGIRFAQIQQQTDSYFNGLLADGDLTRSESNFYGAGPIAGAEMRWKLHKNFSLFGRAEGGLIFGRTNSSLFETNNGGATLYADVTNPDRSVVPMVGLSLGGSYQWRGFTLSAGYQAVNWFGLIQRRTLYDDFAEGKSITQGNDLSLEGFFFRLGMQF